MTSLLLTILLPYVYTDNMVLQREKPFEIRGQASPCATLTVTYGTVSASSQANANGIFAIKMPALPMCGEGKPLCITASPQDRICLTNVVVGDLWLAAGQSNMEFPVQHTQEHEAVIRQANDPLLRVLCYKYPLPTTSVTWSQQQLELARSTSPFQGAWESVTASNCGRFSSIAVQFGQIVRRKLPEVPIGLIQLAVGGAPTEAFLPPAYLQRLKFPDQYPAWCRQRMRKNLGSSEQQGPHPFKPGYLYEYGLRPLEGFSIQGILWYQGESNATDETNTKPLPAEYMLDVTRALRKSLSERFPQTPVVMTMLPKLNRPWEPFRAVQTQVSSECSNTGLIQTRDLGDEKDVHPRHKTPFATRLADEAMRIAYHEKK